MDFILLFLLFCLVLFVAVILFTLAWAGLSAAPWVPVKRKDISRIFKLAEFKDEEVFYDLGCGDGRLLVGAVKDSSIKAVGIEFSLLQYFFCWFKIKILGLSNKISLKLGSFYQMDLSPADVVFTFLTPMAMKKLKPKFEKELKPGSRLISYAFAVPGWQPKKIDKPDKNSVSIFVYQR